MYQASARWQGWSSSKEAEVVPCLQCLQASFVYKVTADCIACVFPSTCCYMVISVPICTYISLPVSSFKCSFLFPANLHQLVICSSHYFSFVCWAGYLLYNPVFLCSCYEISSQEAGEGFLGSSMLLTASTYADTWRLRAFSRHCRAAMRALWPCRSTFASMQDPLHAMDVLWEPCCLPL